MMHSVYGFMPVAHLFLYGTHFLNMCHIYVNQSLIFLPILLHYCYNSIITIFTLTSTNSPGFSFYSPMVCNRVSVILTSLSVLHLIT